MIIAGEASGDLHAAKLVHAVKAQRPEIDFFGIGGSNMRAAGVDTLVDARDMAVVGLVEIWSQRKIIFGALHRMRALLRQQPPTLLILVDYPEFNLRLAKTAKQLGIKVLYYISPQIWAWRQHRVKTIRQRVDHMAVVFPFEVAFYAKHQVPVTFVGHPLVDAVHASATREQLHRQFKIDPTQPVIGLFPGSRHSEIKRLLPIILHSAREFKQLHPHTQFLLPLAPTLASTDLRAYVSGYEDLSIQIINDRTYDVIVAVDAIVTVSGTVTLEIALLGTPMVIINRLAPLTYQIVRRMLKIPYIGLCNIVADRRIVPELIQDQATAPNIATELQRLVFDQPYRNAMIKELGGIEAKLGDAGGINNLARLVLEMLEK
ncbi:MAG: lipid-A-disaccharide synthase [Gammaproteobacteria bacterium]|nr:lipid-A-disaccharide synthase [Gammaproteobacteria bacterium]